MAPGEAASYPAVGMMDNTRDPSLEAALARLADYLGSSDGRVGPPRLDDRSRAEGSTRFVEHPHPLSVEPSNIAVLRGPRRAPTGNLGQRRPQGGNRNGKVDASKVIGWGVFVASLSFSVAVLVT